MFFKISALKNFADFTGKIPVLGSFIKKVAGPQTWKSIKKGPKHRSYPVKFAAF